jgi:drug/metabolite transporter (DMT)-like permease
MAFVFLLYALFASVFTISKFTLQHAEPFFLVGARMLLAGGAMTLFYRAYSGPFTIKKETWWRILLLAICNIYLTNVFEFWGLKYLTSFKTCFIYSLSPFLSAFFSYFLFNDSLSFKKWTGLAVGFLGFIPILAAQTAQEELTGKLWIFSWAELAVVLACISSVYGWIVLKQLVSQDGISPVLANGLSMLIGSGFALGHSFLVENWHPIPVSDFWPFLEGTLCLILISNCICYNLYGHLLKRFSATFMSFAGLTTPIFTAILGWLVHNEVTSTSFWISFAIVCLGLVIFYQEELKEGKGFIRAKTQIA